MSAIEDLLSMQVTFHDYTVFVERIWSLKENVTSYDASYIALAETLQAPLLTRDRKLAGSSGHSVTLELFE